ncbi:ABC transporter substrate-binding protein [Pseudalkalibacillus sp. SCS-8]|uniref:ABC transporter substrate-binding protein n=1 Tax=Pseudalkalibacillus nanhaiensis TaxID=3115291 RepID=UPI0032DA9A31
MRGKKTFSFMMVMMLVASMILSACSDQEASNDADGKVEGEITVWTMPFVGEDLKDKQTKMWDDIKSTFEEKYPDATVKFEEIPWANREQKILTALAANSGPDVFYIIPDQMTQFADKGVLEPLSKYLEDEDTEDFTESSLEAATYGGKLYALPILREVQTYYYNTTILEELGLDPNSLPTTWAEYEDWAKKAVDAGYYARNFEGSNTLNATLYPLIWQAGGEILTPEGEVKVNDAAAVKAFKKVNEWYQKEYIPKDSINALNQFNLFMENKMMSGWYAQSAITAMKSEGFEDYVIGPPLKEEETAGFGVTGMFTMPSNSKNKPTAAAFIKHITNKDNTIQFNELTGYLPPRESAASMFDDNPKMKQLSEYVQYAKPGVMHPASRSVIPKVQAEVQAMLEGTKSPEEAAKAAAEAIQSEVDKLD